MTRDEYADGVKAGAMGAMEAALAGVALRDAAWARLVKAECDIVDCQRGEIAGARDERRDARQALRDIGVDVDALLGD